MGVRGWGVAHPSWYTPRGNQRGDLKLTREERERVAERIVGKPFVLMHDNNNKSNRLGTVTAAFVDKGGTLHTQFEFDGKNLHSKLIERKALRKKCHGLSLAVLASQIDGVVQQADVPIELTACPLSMARKGDACEMYLLDGQWLCEDSKREAYKRTLEQAGYALEENEAESEPVEHPRESTTATSRRESMSTSEQQQQQQQEPRKKAHKQRDEEMDDAGDDEMQEDAKRSAEKQGGLEQKMDLILRQLEKAEAERDALKNEKQEKQRAELHARQQQIEGAFQDMLQAVEAHLKMLLDEGLDPTRVQGLMNQIETAAEEKDPEIRSKRMEEVMGVMQLVNFSHTALEKQQKRAEEAQKSYKMLATQLKSTRTEKQRALDTLERHERARKERKEKYKSDGIASRVDTGDAPARAPASTPAGTSSSASSKRKMGKRRASTLPQETSAGADDVPGERDSKKGKNKKTTIHARLATDLPVDPSNQSALARKPVIGGAFMEHAPIKPGATFGIPAITGGLQKNNPGLYERILSEWRATAPTGQPRNEFRSFGGKIYSGGDIPDGPVNGKFRVDSAAAPRLPAPGELLGVN